jgi:hypothetical protein
LGGRKEPHLNANAFSLVQEYASNEVSADQKYKGKTLTVTGVTERIAKDMMGYSYVELKGHEFRGVQCYFEDDAVLAKLGVGQQIKVTGTCEGLMMNVQLKECVLQ